MDDQRHIRTATMAKIYTQQGHYRKAADIYRYLLAQDPSRHDIAGALAEVEAMQEPQQLAGEKNLAPLVREWIRLAVRYRQVRQLQRMRKKLYSAKIDKAAYF